MRTFTCPHCGHTEDARMPVVAIWHPCSSRRSKTGKPLMTEMTPQTPENET